jgi:hypothetical protein
VKKQIIYIISLLLVVFTAFSGCKTSKQDESDFSESTTNTIGTAPPLLDIEIDKLVTTEQVSDALGIPVRPPHLADSNTTVRYYSEDSRSYLEIIVEETIREIFDETVSLYEDAVDVDDVGQSAKWSAEQKQLLVYNGKYMMSITAFMEDKNDEDLLLSARKIAELILDKLGVLNG